MMSLIIWAPREHLHLLLEFIAGMMSLLTLENQCTSPKFVGHPDGRCCGVPGPICHLGHNDIPDSKAFVTQLTGDRSDSMLFILFTTLEYLCSAQSNIPLCSIRPPTRYRCSLALCSDRKSHLKLLLSRAVLAASLLCLSTDSSLSLKMLST